MKTIKYYHDLYLKYDILFLAAAFEEIRNSSLKNYGLCPSHYFSAPGLRWDVMLKMTKIKQELISDWVLYIYIYIYILWEMESFKFLIDTVMY